MEPGSIAGEQGRRESSHAESGCFSVFEQQTTAISVSDLSVQTVKRNTAGCQWQGWCWWVGSCRQ